MVKYVYLKFCFSSTQRYIACHDLLPKPTPNVILCICRSNTTHQIVSSNGHCMRTRSFILYYNQRCTNMSHLYYLFVSMLITTIGEMLRSVFTVLCLCFCWCSTYHVPLWSMSMSIMRVSMSKWSQVQFNCSVTVRVLFVSMLSV
jgi:hypothetical protein